jgi:hypothetical protein
MGSENPAGGHPSLVDRQGRGRHPRNIETLKLLYKFCLKVNTFSAIVQ